jgi:hypothetical protein
VTRLGESSPLGWLFTLDNFLIMTKVALIVGLFFSQKQLNDNFDKMRVGLHFGRFFLSWSPWSKATVRDETCWKIHEGSSSTFVRGCQIYLGTWYQNRIKCTKCTQNVPNGQKISQMSVKHSRWP